jgi:hypothetical protein
MLVVKRTMYVKTAEPYAEPPHYVDIHMAISKLKNGKTTGHDQIPVEFMTQRGKELKKVIYEFIPKIWVEEIYYMSGNMALSYHMSGNMAL